MHILPPAVSTATAPPPQSPTLLPAVKPLRKVCSLPHPLRCPRPCLCPPRYPVRRGLCQAWSVGAVVVSAVQVVVRTLNCSRDWLQAVLRGGSSFTPLPSDHRALRASMPPALSATLHLSCLPPTITARDTVTACSYAQTTTRDPRQPSSPTYSGWPACHPSVVSPRLTALSPPACHSVWMDWGGLQALRRTESQKGRRWAEKIKMKDGAGRRNRKRDIEKGRTDRSGRTLSL